MGFSINFLLKILSHFRPFLEHSNRKISHKKLSVNMIPADPLAFTLLHFYIHLGLLDTVRCRPREVGVYGSVPASLVVGGGWVGRLPSNVVGSLISHRLTGVCQVPPSSGKRAKNENIDF